jgi:hypothetical protein
VIPRETVRRVVLSLWSFGYRQNMGRTGGEMSEQDDSATKRYRKRAEEIRLIAAKTTEPLARKTLLEVADDFDRLARFKERAARPIRT